MQSVLQISELTLLTVQQPFKSLVLVSEPYLVVVTGRHEALSQLTESLDL